MYKTNFFLRILSFIFLFPMVSHAQVAFQTLSFQANPTNMLQHLLTQHIYERNFSLLRREIRYIAGQNPYVLDLIDTLCLSGNFLEVVTNISQKSACPLSLLAVLRCVLQATTYEQYIHSNLTVSELSMIAATADLLDIDMDENIDVSIAQGFKTRHDLACFLAQHMRRIDLNAPRAAELVKNYVLQGADINWQDADGNTILIDAIAAQNAEIISILLKAGASTNIANKEKMMPLMYAAMVPSWRTIYDLLYFGAKPSLRNHEGDSALDIANQQTPVNEGIINLLKRKQHRSQLDRVRLDFISSLVAELDLVYIQRVINEVGLNKHDMKHIGPLKPSERYASFLSRIIAYKIVYTAETEAVQKMVSTLIKRGADLHWSNDSGDTLLMYASLYGRVAIVDLLIEAGVSIYSKGSLVTNKSGDTALRFALLSREYEMINLLLQKMTNKKKRQSKHHRRISKRSLKHHK